MSEEKKPEVTPSPTEENNDESKEDASSQQIDTIDPSSEPIKIDAQDEEIAFFDKIKRFYFLQVYNVNHLLIKIWPNLIFKKNRLEANSNLLEKQPLIRTLERDADNQDRIKNINEQITNTSSALQNDMEDAKVLYTEGQFNPSKDLTKKLFWKSQKYGLKDFKPPLKTLKKANQVSLKYERKLAKFPEKDREDLDDKVLLRYYLQLENYTGKIDSFISENEAIPAIHPQVQEIGKTLLTSYKDVIKKKNLNETEPSFFDKLQFWFINRWDSIQISIKNYQLAWFIFKGQKWKNLPKAWTSIQTAETFINNNPNTIYPDYQRRFFKTQLDTKDFIDALDTETKDILDQTHSLMEEFRYKEAFTLLNQYSEKLLKYSMKKLDEQIQDQIKVCEINADLNEDRKEIKTIYEMDEFLKAHKLMDVLLKKMEEIPDEILIHTLKQTVEELDEEIRSSRKEEEDILQNRLVKLKEDLLNDLDFEKARAQLQKDKNLAEAQEYGMYLDEYKQFMIEFRHNFNANDTLKEIQTEIDNENFGSAQKKIQPLLTSIKKREILFYSKLEAKITKIDETINTLIDKESEYVQNQINIIDELIEKEIDIQEAEKTLNAIIDRINHTELEFLKEKLEDITEKLKVNRDAYSDQQEIQILFSEGDINEADQRCSSLLKSLQKKAKKSPDLYSNALIESLQSLQEQINAALKDGVDSLQSDFNKIDRMIEKTLSFGQIQTLLANYKIRAIRLGLDEIKTDIEEKLLEVIKNSNFIEEKDELRKKYENKEEFKQTLTAIDNLKIKVEDTPDLYDHVVEAITDFHKQVQKESKDREAQMEQALQDIVKNQVNQLKFDEAEQSLKQLHQTATNLAVSSIKADIDGYLGICTSHQGLLDNVKEIENVFKSDNLMQARELIAGLISSMGQYKGVIIQPMRNRVQSLQDSIQNERNKRIKAVEEQLKEILKEIEAKRAKNIYEELLSLEEKAKYLQDDGIIKEISNLIRLSELQLDPDEIRRMRGEEKKKSKEKQTETVIKTFTMDEVASQVDDGPQTAIFSIKKSDLDFLEEQSETPDFNSLPEKRAYKRKQQLIKRTKRIRAPKTDENLNNNLRSSVTRRRLQLYDRQVNRPLKTRSVTKCPHCGADQPEQNGQYCFFCGQFLIA